MHFQYASSENCTSSTKHKAALAGDDFQSAATKLSRTRIMVHGSYSSYSKARRECFLWMKIEIQKLADRSFKKGSTAAVYLSAHTYAFSHFAPIDYSRSASRTERKLNCAEQRSEFMFVFQLFNSLQGRYLHLKFAIPISVELNLIYNAPVLS
jgi:hypothetical protein